MAEILPHGADEDYTTHRFYDTLTHTVNNEL